ncbi:MAG: helix-turn-helix domain-containing protein [Gluconacetobacter sp.]
MENIAENLGSEIPFGVAERQIAYIFNVSPFDQNKRGGAKKYGRLQPATSLEFSIMARKPIGMHVEDIKAALRKKFGTLAALSRHLGVHPNTVSITINQPGHSVPMERKICDILGHDPHEVWPDRFHPDGSPVRTRVDRTPTALRGEEHRANGVAA